MQDIKIEKYGIEISIPWEGKTILLTVGLEEAIKVLSIGFGEPDVWKILAFLQNAKNYNAELEKIHTTKGKIIIDLKFSSEKDFEKFREDHRS